MTDFLITLPWPPKSLSPNSRKAHRYNKDDRAGYKTAGFIAAKQIGAIVPADAHMAISFYPPDKRRRDLDNLLGSIKYGLDGIALASNVDDYGWSISIERCQPVKGGAVLVHVKPALVGVELRGVVT